MGAQQQPKEKHTITKIAVSIEMDGKPYHVAIEQGYAEIACKMIAPLCPENRLTLIPAEDGFQIKLATIKDIQER